jgi:hypothetical protein
MADFKFDIDKSVNDNIAKFFDLIKHKDEEMAGLLISNIDKMTPSARASAQ